MIIWLGKKGRERRLSLLENLDEIAIIKQIIAKEHPVILEGELRQQEELPKIPEGKENVSFCSELNHKSVNVVFASSNYELSTSQLTM